MKHEPTLFLITGRRRAGKDTFARNISRAIYDAWPDVATAEMTVKHSFAKPIKDVAKTIFGWSDDYVENGKETIDERFGLSPRQFMQSFGTDFMRNYLRETYPEYGEKTGDRIWTKTAENHIRSYLEQGYNVTVPDVRFPNEMELATVFYHEGYKIVTIGIVDVTRSQGVDNHESEQYADELVNVCDYIVYNNMTETDFFMKTNRILMEMTFGRNKE